MIYSVYTYNAHAINDTTNYVAWFGNESFYRQGDGPSKIAHRTERTPVMLGVSPVGKTFTLVIEPQGTIHTNWEELNKWFDTHDPALYRLIVKDTADADRQWYVDCRPVKQSQMSVQKKVVYEMEALDPIWRTVTQESDAWAITASGQTRNLTLVGNRYARPIFRITPTDTKTDGFQYHIVRAWRNPNSVGQSKRLQDLTNDAWDTAALVNATAVSNQVDNGAGYSDSDLSIAIDTSVGGGLPVNSGMCYCARTGEQIRYDSISGGVMTVNADGRGWGGTTPAALVDNDVLAFSHLAADGRDVRVYVNGVLVPRWLRGINTSTTQVFVNLDWEPGLSLTLETAIDGVSDITAIEFGLNDILNMPELAAKNHKALIIDSEIFTFTSIDFVNQKASGTITRAAYSTSKGAHSAGATVHWLNHRIEIFYGNPAMTAPTQDESAAPLQDLDNTTNTSWKFLLFADTTGLRSGHWQNGPVKGVESYVYYGSHLADADPATELGLVGASYNLGGVVRADTYEVSAHFYDMAGVTTVTMNGDKYRVSTDWPAIAGLQKSSDGRLYTSAFNLSTPGSAGSWTAWSQSAVSLSGTYKYLKFILKGNVKGVSGNYHALELQAATLALSASAVPQLVITGSEQSDAYDLDFKISNNDSGLHLRVVGPIAKNQTIEIDTDAKSVTYLADNSDLFPYLRVDVRGEWLPLDPTIVSDNINTIQVDEDGLVGVTLTTLWENRRA